jgi:hypothetical protein
MDGEGTIQRANMTDDEGWQKPISLMACRCGRVFDKHRLEILQCMSSALPRRNASVTPHGSSMCNLYSITAKQARHYLAFYAGSFDVNAMPWALVCVCPEAIIHAKSACE